MRTIDVGENRVEKARALDQALFERAPFFGRDQQRHHVQLPRTIHALRIAVNVVGNAVFANDFSRVFPAGAEFLGREFIDGGDEAAPMFAWRGTADRGFVEERTDGFVSAEK